MPIRNDYGPLRSADTIAIRVDWNKPSADSLSPWRVISAGRMMNKLRPGRLVESRSNAVALLTIVAQYISLRLQAHPKMTGTVVVA